MTSTLVNRASLLALGLLFVNGCVKTHPTMAPIPPAPNPAPRVAVDPMARVQTLGRLSDEYARTANQLPGETQAQHRRLMAQVFAELEEILPILQGPGPGAEFRQQLDVVRDAQGELASGPRDLSPEPTIDTGLRATRDALASIAQGSYYEQAGLTPVFDKLSAKINQLDTIRGPLHQVVAGEAVGLTSQIVSTMSGVLTHRLAEMTPPKTAATTERATSEPAATAASGK